MRLTCFLLIAIACTMTACQKEPEGFFPPPACKLDHAYYYSSGALMDTAGYEYTGDNASRANYQDWYTEMEYSSNRLAKRSYYEITSGGLAAVEEFTYNTDGSLSKVDFYVYPPGFPVPVLFYEYIFSYASGSLTQLQVKMDTSGTGPVPYLEYNYAATNNNITACYEHDLWSDARDTLNYTFDSNPNYYAKNPGRWVTDYLFMDFSGDWMPFVFSTNNVTGLNLNNGAASVVSYETTDKEELETVSVDGEVLARYFYKCQ